VKRTALALGLPRSTLMAWAKSRGTHAGVTKLCHLKKESLADKFEEVAHALLNAALVKVKTEDAPLRDLVIAVAVCVDKMLLLRGRPTQIDTNPDGSLRGFSHARRRV
jgi:hypothetical protein